MNLDKDDAVSMTHYRLIDYPITKFREIEASVNNFIKGNLSTWLQEEGVPCEVLRTTGGGWIKGKIRIKTVIEFIPDEPVPESTDAVMGGEHKTDQLP